MPPRRCGKKTRSGRPCRITLRGGKCVTHDCGDLAARNKAVRAAFKASDPAAYAAHQGRAMKGRTGEKHPRWNAGSTNKYTGRHRAQRLYPVPTHCERCAGAPAERRKLHRHHRDRNPLNNAAGNIEFLCEACHVAEHDGAYQWFADGMTQAAAEISA